MNASSGVETIFSRDRVEHTLTRGYFEMIGLLSGSKQGLRYAVRHDAGLMLPG